MICLEIWFIIQSDFCYRQTGERLHIRIHHATCTGGLKKRRTFWYKSVCMSGGSNIFQSHVRDCYQSNAGLKESSISNHTGQGQLIPFMAERPMCFEKLRWKNKIGKLFFFYFGLPTLSQELLGAQKWFPTKEKNLGRQFFLIFNFRLTDRFGSSQMRHARNQRTVA